MKSILVNRMHEEAPKTLEDVVNRVGRIAKKQNPVPSVETKLKEKPVKPVMPEYFSNPLDEIFALNLRKTKAQCKMREFGNTWSRPLWDIYHGNVNAIDKRISKLKMKA